MIKIVTYNENNKRKHCFHTDIPRHSDIPFTQFFLIIGNVQIFRYDLPCTIFATQAIISRNHGKRNEKRRQNAEQEVTLRHS